MGGHLTHGWNVSITGRYFTSVGYGVRKDTGRIDYDEVRDLAKKEKPQLLWAGGTAYSRIWDFATMASIAKDVGARFAADIAHIAGLIVGGAHPSPVPHADVVTTTTHKTLRGPRGGMILSRTECAQVIDRAVFPGLQGGPHVHNTAALAVALHEAAQPSFRDYAHRVVANAKVIAEELVARGYQVVSGGTDNHLILVDLTNKNVPGKVAARALDKAGIELNYNSVPYDTRKPFDPSGIRLGSPSVTSRGHGRAGDAPDRGLDGPGHHQPHRRERRQGAGRGPGADPEIPRAGHLGLSRPGRRARGIMLFHTSSDSAGSRYAGRRDRRLPRWRRPRAARSSSWSTRPRCPGRSSTTTTASTRSRPTTRPSSCRARRSDRSPFSCRRRARSSRRRRRRSIAGARR